ncbi:uncharacterized protein ANIA_10831 [Aspergillus nidulans FGSC A4]|uniref:Uncharacterized protein n=1 Tax=Emericella nidulans (strain FGSC A4 / ATCC 38163 / CBS 112.46 / NRRL 194 / M139) TaxID=227321 RepID=C8V0S3_EMENI|nr:hypothetical protein [Aspergillus nidulans FGSC A4]CBF70948.1 TPA: conserved hypothetical protein [Aspergillus nidulans FGSC A4]
MIHHTCMISRSFKTPKPCPTSERLSVPCLKTRNNAFLFALNLDLELTNLVHSLAFFLENILNGTLRAFFDDNNHANTAVEGAGHLMSGDVALLFEP